MNGFASGSLEDLLTTAKPVGDDQGVRCGTSHSGEQDSFTDRLRNLVLVALKAKRSGHPTATGIEKLEFCAHFAKQGLLGTHFHQRLLVTVAVQHYFPGQPRRLVLRSMFLKEFAQEKGLAP